MWEMVFNVEDAIKRQSIIRAFNQIKDYRIIAVCAPAGYGKTVAVNQWIEKDGRIRVVFSSDEYDNNFGGFCERFCATLRICQPQNQTLNEIISHSDFEKTPDEFTLRAVAALSSRNRTVLVIDDIHLIHNNAVLQFLFVTIKRLPKNFQIILISRHELPAEFSDLWLKEQAASINRAQLLFSDDEVMALYNKRGKKITKKQAKDINRQAHGWAIGIKALLLSNGESFDEAYDYDKAYSYMDDFIRKNIWEKEDPTTCEFMIRTAFLRELTPELCEKMTGITNSKKFLNNLVRNGAFITQARRGVYRYHHLFQQFLIRIAQERGESFVASLLEQEGYWHLSQKDFYSAAQCFIRCKSHDGIEECYYLLGAESYFAVESYFLLGKESYFAVEGLLPIFEHPEFIAAAKKHPHLLYLAAYGAFAEGNISIAAAYMDEYYARYPEIVTHRPDLMHCINYVRMLDFRVSLNQVMEQVVVPDGISNITTSIWRISIHSLLYSLQHSPQMHRGINNLTDLAIGDVAANVVNNFSPKMGWLYGPMFDVDKEIITAGLLYEQNNLDVAHNYASKAYSMLEHQHSPDAKSCAMIILVYILDALGEAGGASTIIKTLSKMIDKAAEKDRAYHLYDNFNAFIARRKIVAGDIAVAEKWLSGNTDVTFPLRKIYIAFITSRALIVTKDHENAVIMLKRILEISRTSNRHLDTIEAHILLAIIYWKKKGRFQNEALNHLEAAVSVAHTYNFVQMFVNDGALLVVMMRKLLKRVEQRDNVDNSMIYFAKMLYLKIRSGVDNGLPVESEESLIELTAKQKAVITLFSQGKRRKDVAEALGIKESTVVSHLGLIYGKLDVSNLVDAIAKVKLMGLME